MEERFLNETETSTQINYKSSNIFEEQFPFYLSIGMSYTEYWESDPSLTRYFRKAYLNKQKDIDFQCWLQGKYIYDGICCIANNIFDKNSRETYPSKPYLNKDEKEIKNTKEEEKQSRRKLELARSKKWLEDLEELYNKKK